MDLMPQLDVWAMIREATPTVKAVLAILAAMSVLSWAVILHKLVTLLPAVRASRAALAETLAAMERGGQLTAALALAGNHPRAPLAGAARAALAVLTRAGDGPASPALLAAAARAATLAGTQALRDHERGLGILAACSGAAPFIGLFGTVWGVMHAFNAAVSAVDGLERDLEALTLGLAAVSGQEP